MLTFKSLSLLLYCQGFCWNWNCILPKLNWDCCYQDSWYLNHWSFQNIAVQISYNKMPTKIIYVGATYYVGSILLYHNLYWVEMTWNISCYWKTNTKIYTIVWIAVTWTHSFLETKVFFLTDTITVTLYKKLGLLQTIFKFLQHINHTQFILDNDLLPQLERSNYAHIMELVLSSTKCNTIEIHYINYFPFIFRCILSLIFSMHQ